MINYLYYVLVFRLIQLLAAGGIIFGISRCWAARPESGIIRFVRHRQRVWFALALFFLPMILEALLFRRLFISLAISHALSGWNPVLGGLLNILYGAIYGLAGCLFAAHGRNVDRIRPWIAFAFAGAMVALSALPMFLTNLSRGWFGGYLPGVVVVLVAVTFLASRAFPAPAPATSTADAVAPKTKSPALALFLAFLPSVMFLGFYSMLVRTNNLAPGPLVFACVVSIVCCFTASIMLFRRNTGLAIFAGVIFLLLNAAISFLFGCGVLLSNMNM